MTKKIYYCFEQNRFSCNSLCASFTRRIAHMQKGAFQTIQEPFQKSNSNFTSRVALSKGCDQPQSRLRHVRVEPRVFCCDLLLAFASTLHLAICGGCTVTRPRPKPLNGDAARVTNSGECTNEFSYILEVSWELLSPSRALDPSHVCMNSPALSQCAERIAYCSQGRLT